MFQVDYNLSEKYQLVDNEKTGKILLWIACAHTALKGIHLGAWVAVSAGILEPRRPGAHDSGSGTGVIRRQIYINLFIFFVTL